MLSINDASQRERAAAAAVGTLPRTLKREVSRVARDIAAPLVRREASARADTSTMRTIANSGRGTNSRGIPSVTFGGTAAVTSDGTSGRVLAWGLERGSQGLRKGTYQRRRTGGTLHTVTRRVTRQFYPAVSDPGAFVGPAVEAAGDDVITAWLDAVEVALVKALDSGGR